MADDVRSKLVGIGTNIKRTSKPDGRRQSPIERGLEDKLQHVLSLLSDFLMLKLEAFLYSEEGEDLLYQSIQQLLARQGVLANMLGSFLAKDRLVDKIRPVLLHVLRKPSTKKLLQEQLNEALAGLLDKPIGELLAPFAEENKAVTQSMSTRVTQLVKSATSQMAGRIRDCTVGQSASALISSCTSGSADHRCSKAGIKDDHLLRGFIRGDHWFCASLYPNGIFLRKTKKGSISQQMTLWNLFMFMRDIYLPKYSFQRLSTN